MFQGFNVSKLRARAKAKEESIGGWKTWIGTGEWAVLGSFASLKMTPLKNHERIARVPSWHPLYIMAPCVFEERDVLGKSCCAHGSDIGFNLETLKPAKP
jgi:hypothetical protein